MKKNVLIIGTGTIGEPLIGLLADLKDEFNINVFFHKRTPLVDEYAKVESLCDRGAKLTVDQEKWNEFLQLRHKPNFNFERALSIANVVIDCTPSGNDNKERNYLPIVKEEENFGCGKRKRIFIAQGSEKGFGLPYAYGINDSALVRSTPNFVQVVSCNTHNICSILKSLSPELDTIIDSDFTCIRRANDISQNGSFIASPQVGGHPDNTFGTHHARDASRVLETMYYNLPIYSSAMKINSQYMHTIRFNVTLAGHHDKQSVEHMFRENPFIALTYKNLANKVFSFGRDHGYYGRIFNQAVISLPSLGVTSLGGTTKVTGFCFTPQDGNSLLSSIAAALYGLYGKDYEEKMKVLNKHLFSEI
tara:strand:- start:1497 stop:2582 length:1086 start_codon:yes stop_codon:yes gene_type:complete